jgi:hypothetical protein
MRKTIVLVAAALIMAVALVASAGCGGSTKSTTGSVSEADLGVPIYPGATKTDVNGGQPGPNSGMGQSAPGPPPNGGQGSAPNRMPQGSIPQQGRGSMTALWTADSTDKVTTWYRDKLKGKTGFSETTPPAGGPSAQAGGTATMFSFKSGDTYKTVMIRNSNQDKGGTVIMVIDAPQGMPSGTPNNQTSSPSSSY